MENYQQYCEEIRQLLDGKIKADKVSEKVNEWLMLTCYSLAYEVAKKETKQQRRESLEQVKELKPLFYDDVSALARKIYKDRLTHQTT